MAFTLPDLPYAKDALAPTMSAETFDYHHGKHHRTYVDKLNGLVDGNDYAGLDLDAVVKKSAQEGKAAIFNNAAQHWNHSFFWECMTPGGSAMPEALEAAIVRDFGSVADFRAKFLAEGAGHFGSGWVWLVQKADGALAVVSTHDAGCPITDGHMPLIVCDLWEHAYYVDHRNARPAFLEAFFDKLADWEAAGERLAA